MNLEKIKNFKFEKRNFNFKELKDSFWEFVLERFGLLAMLIFFIAFVVSGFLIYKNLYSPGWSEAQKEEYRAKIEDNKAGFNVDNFNRVIQKIEQRSASSDDSFEFSRDIFGSVEKK